MLRPWKGMFYHNPKHPNPNPTSIQPESSQHPNENPAQLQYSSKCHNHFQHINLTKSVLFLLFPHYFLSGGKEKSDIIVIFYQTTVKLKIFINY